ncbi:CD209 antigen-like protein C [Ctenopharyngodon idella]|uniref:CD209 antigen-like protein C n=1 Tax=Ctenopharyngodon idella TaxID=7959 RepID=UPI00223220FC|nr:CD209 antigen-like protein C [Ctenopharyngodon idella]
MSGLVNDGMDKGSMMESEDRIEKTVDIYVSAEAVRDMKHKKDTEDFNTSKTQTPQHTGSDSVRIRSSRAALVCLVLLCVLLLTAVIVLCVQLFTNNSTNYTEETHQLLTNITNLTDERDQLLNKITNITEERNELLTNNTNLTKERDELKIKNKNLINEKDQLRNTLQIFDKLTTYKFSFYYISNETKSWNESRRYCTEKGADLVIINNSDEQDFVNHMSGAAVVWIGLTDSDVEGRWKWVDGTNMTSGFWESRSNEPNGGTSENCAVTVDKQNKEWPNHSGWIDVQCNKIFQWICEKNISKLIMP